MRRPPYPPIDELSATGSMTPMIDVVFLLLIFFVCAASGQERVDFLSTELPPSGGIEALVEPPEEAAPKDRLWISLRQDAGGRTVIELNEREYDNFERLKQVLVTIAELAADSPVILDIGGNVPVGAMIRVYDICKGARFESISFATEAPATRKTAPQSP